MMDRVTATMLLDYYGALLTEKQQALCDCYFNQDLSFSEIAELEGISRQGVRDAVTKAEAILRNYEEKTGYLAREQALRQLVSRIRQAALNIQSLGGPGAAQADLILQALDGISDPTGKETDPWPLKA